MRIVIASQTYLPGNNGQAIFTIHLAEGLARIGHEVHVITGGEDLKYRRLFVNGVQVHLMPSIGFTWLHPGAYFTIYPDYYIRRIFNDYPPDVVHIQDHYFLCRGVVAVARPRKIPLLGTNHFLPENLLPYLSRLPLPKVVIKRLLWATMLWTYNHLQMVTTPTETAAKILSQQNTKFPILPISCGVDTNSFCPGSLFDRESIRNKFCFDTEKPVVLYVGRHDKEKRIDLLVRAVALLRQQGITDFTLALAGQGAAKEELQSLVRTLGIESQVRFLGYVSTVDLKQLLQAADIFAMPSPEELQSIATLEAMASGKPILAANARALPELVTPGMNGLLFEPGDAESLSRALLDLLQHPESWQKMGHASRSRAIGHSLDNTIRRYESIYQKLCSQSAHAVTKQVKMHLRPAGRD